MIKIISVEKDKANKYKVKIANETYCLSENVIIKYRLFKDKYIQEKQLEAILAEEKNEELLMIALKYLQTGNRSEYEVYQYINKKIQDKGWMIALEKINELLIKLKNLNFINDLHLAKQILNYYQESGKGPKYIESKLRNKKIIPEIIQEVLSSYTEELAIIAIEKILPKIINKQKNYPIKKQKELIFKRLLNYGFSQQLIIQEIEKITFEDNSDDKLQRDFERYLQKSLQKNFTDYQRKQYIVQHLLNKGYEYSKIMELF